MFLQVSVILFTGGVAWSRGGGAPGVPGPRGMCLVRQGGAWSQGVCFGGCLVETPRTATAAGGTHPT